MKANRQKYIYIVLITIGILFFVFKIRLAFDLLLVVLAVIALFQKEPKKFIKDWLPPTALFFVYEYLRGQAYNWHSATINNGPIVDALVNIERGLFFFLYDIPTVVLQQTFHSEAFVYHWYDLFIISFYLSFFVFWLFTGYIIWSRRHKYFKMYMYGLLASSFIGVIIFYFWPTAPPWYASDVGIIPEVSRIFWETGSSSGQELTILSTYGDNPFAALPSHHAGWPFWAALMIIRAFGKKYWYFLIIPILIAFSTWYGGEHYVIDSLAGFAIAGFVFALTSEKVLSKFSKKNIKNS